MAKNWIEITANLVFWVLTASLITLGFSIHRVEHTVENGIESIRVIRDQAIIWNLLQWIGFSAVIFYSNLWLIKRSKRDITGIAMRSAILIAVALACIFFITETTAQSGSAVLPEGLVFGTVVFYYALSATYGIGKRWLRAELAQKNLLVEKKQAELNLLRNQLQPHFLFNALNNLLAMVDQQRDKPLARAIDKLSQMLRYVVVDTENQTVAIRDEIAFIQNYCEMQKLRFSDDEIDLKFTVHGSHTDQEVEPGIFIPFVENAFKHGTFPEEKAQIALCFDLSQIQAIHFSIQNSISGNRHTIESGSGIALSRKRLNLLYPNRHTLHIENKADEYQVELQLQTDVESNNSR